MRYKLTMHEQTCAHHKLHTAMCEEAWPLEDLSRNRCGMVFFMQCLPLEPPNGRIKIAICIRDGMLEAIGDQYSG